MNWADCYSAYRRANCPTNGDRVITAFINVAFWAAILGAMYYGTR